MPTAFCRECGQDYLAVTRSDTGSGRRYAGRRDNDASGGDEASGYLFISDDQPWPPSLEQVLVEGRLPYSWLAYDPVAGAGRRSGPAEAAAGAGVGDVTGREAGPGEGTYAAYVPSPFRFCLRCRTSYEQARGSDFAKLAKLSAEGRSSAMSLITASIVRTLRTWEGDLDDRARKLLAFVDNRQDASLQAGHFNDFVQVTQLRGALYRALEKAPGGPDRRDRRAAGHRGARPGHGRLRAQPRREVQPAGRGVAGAARGDRVPALPGPGTRLAGHHAQPGADRAAAHPVPRPARGGRRRRGLAGLPRRAARGRPGAPAEIAAALLDELRRNLAIDVEYLSDDGFDQVRRLSAQHLREPWSLPERELPPVAGVAFPGPGKRGQRRSNVYLSGRGQFGRFLIREYANRRITLKTADAQEIITDLFACSARPGCSRWPCRPTRTTSRATGCARR